LKSSRLTQKILLVLHTPPPYGGGEIQALNMKEFFGRDEKFHIYDYSRKNHSRAKWDSKFNLVAIIAGIWWEIKVVFLLFSLMPDKVYFTLPKSFMGFMRNAMVIPVAKMLKVKILGELPGTSFLFLEKGRGVKYNIGLFFLRRIDEIRLLSPRISELHCQYKFKKHIIIENGIEPDYDYTILPEILDQIPLNLIYVGSIERSKGIFNSIEAVKLCIEKEINLHFHIVGYWPNATEEMEALTYIKRNRLESVFTFHGILTGSSKWALYSKSAVLVHPTFWDGVPLTILEALSVGLPVISTNVGGIPDTIKDGTNGKILPDNTPEILAKSIEELNSNRRLLHSMSKSNKALFKERFTLSIFLKNMETWFTN
jgi:glycosyltransferase involved in cell wall biosynthesis